jgi:hypothetical protein
MPAFTVALATAATIRCRMRPLMSLIGWLNLTAYPQVTLEHRIALQLWIYQRNVW